MPDKINKKMGLSQLRVYVQALNPGFVFNKVPWIDLDVNYHASNRGFVAGINLQF
jgi:TonB-dependent starch-binding outer membrane protein SusC